MSTEDTAEGRAQVEAAPGRRWVTIAAGVALAVTLFLVVRSCLQPDAGAEAFCARVQRIGAITTAEQLQGEGGQATLSDLRSALARLRARSPSAVRGDVTTLAEVTGRLQDALDSQDRGSAAERERATADLDAGLAAFEQSSGRVVAYAEETCGIDLDG